jgi:hypothetical protein
VDADAVFFHYFCPPVEVLNFRDVNSRCHLRQLLDRCAWWTAKVGVAAYIFNEISWMGRWGLRRRDSGSRGNGQEGITASRTVGPWIDGDVRRGHYIFPLFGGDVLQKHAGGSISAVVHIASNEIVQEWKIKIYINQPCCLWS